MTVGTTAQTFRESAYLTVAEYKNAPTAIDYDNLVVSGNAQAQDAELLRVIQRASSYLDEYLNQNLVATKYVETQRTRITPQGYVSLHPFNAPVIALETFEYGVDPNYLQTIPDLSNCWFESQQVIVPLTSANLSWSTSGPLGFGNPNSPRNILFVQYQYVAGFVNTTLAATATLGASSITVRDGAGILAGQSITIYDGAATETVTVAPSYTYGSTTVPLVAPLVAGHNAGVAFSAMPTAIKQAAILATTAFLKVRGDNSLTMSITTRPQGTVPTNQMIGSDLQLALDMVSKYRRVR